jgi:hypothetical protein
MMVNDELRFRCSRCRNKYTPSAALSIANTNATSNASSNASSNEPVVMPNFSYESDNDNTGHDGEDVKKMIAIRLCNSWFGRQKSTPDMKKGTANESSVIRALLKLKWVGKIYDVGMLAMQSEPWIAASADGVVQVQPPPGGDFVRASLEIKTKVSEATQATAVKVRKQIGSMYVECTAGNPLWFMTIPWAYRGQLIQQALVLNVDYVLFVMATVTGIVYVVLVKVPVETRTLYLESLKQYKRLVSWAHSSSGDNIQVPTCFPREYRIAAETHLPLWKTFMALPLPVPPVRVIKSGVQVLYSVLKAGVDGATQYISYLRDPKIRYDYDQKVVTDGLFSLVTNAIILQRTLKTFAEYSNDEQKIPGIDQFRDRCSRNQGNYVDSVLDLSAEFVIDAMTTPLQNSSPPIGNASSSEYVSVSTTASHHKTKSRNRLKQFNQPALRQTRLSQRNGHQMGYIDRTGRRRCIICKRRTQTFCLQCTQQCNTHVAVCKQKRGNDNMTCFDYFHSADILVTREI